MRKFHSLLIAAAMAVGLSACGNIESGNVGVRTTWSGEVKLQEERQGTYVALFDSVREYTAKEITVPLDIKPKAKDNLSLADFKADITYSVNPDQVADMRIAFANADGHDDDANVYLPAYNLVATQAGEAAFKAVSKFDSLTAHTKRDEIAHDMRNLLQSKLDARRPGAFKITNVTISSLLTDKGIEQSIRAKATAENELAAMDAKLQTAKKQAELNEALAKSATKEFIALENAKALTALATAGKVSAIVVPMDFKGMVNVQAK